jgi:nitroreductase
MDLATAEGDVELDPHGKLDAESAGLVEHGPFAPAVGGKRVVVGDGQRAHAARSSLGQERRGVEIPVARARVEVEVGYHPVSHYSRANMTESFAPLSFERLSLEESRARVAFLRDLLRRRRSVRDFSPEPVPLDLVDTAIEAAASAPSGANRQPWRFVVVRDPEVKRRIREAAEKEEREFYERKATPSWLADLAPLGTGWHKPFLETAPFLVAVFALDWEEETLSGGPTRRHKGYYVQESVGIAVGMLLAALHGAGLATLTHTPSPMGFLSRVLGRPRNERPFLLVPVGYPAEGTLVPVLHKKTLDEVRTIV